MSLILLLSNGNWSAPAYGGNYLKTKTNIYEHDYFTYKNFEMTWVSLKKIKIMAKTGK